MRWVIAYDVTADKRRRKVARRLEQLGFRRQKSVFEGDLVVPEIDALLAELGTLLDPATDSLTAWPASDHGDATLKHVGAPRADASNDWRIL